MRRNQVSLRLSTSTSTLKSVPDIIYRVCQPEQLVRLTFTQCPLINQRPSLTSTLSMLSWLSISSRQTLAFILSAGGGDALRTLIYSPLPPRQAPDALHCDAMITEIVAIFAAARTLPALREVNLGFVVPINSLRWFGQTMPHITRLGIHFSCVIRRRPYALRTYSIDSCAPVSSIPTLKTQA